MIDWTGLDIHFNMTDIMNGVLQTFNSFKGLVFLVVGMSLAFYALSGLLAVFRGESFWPWNRD
ncbi:MAG: hypothetical protein ACM3UN_04305 [Bacillota bacterium]